MPGRENYLYWERIRHARTERLETELANAQAVIADKDAMITSKDAEINRLRALLENK